VVEFSDYQCPFCAQFALTSEPELFNRFVDAGTVLWVFKNLPLESIHPYAMPAARAAECAGQQNLYWPMHDLLFRNQLALESANLELYAERAGAGLAAFRTCMSDGQSLIARDLEDARRLGIRGTPTFLIGTLNAGQVTISSGLRGAGQPGELATLIEQVMLAESAGR
jgi:protein-disulfide isomerase